MPELNLFQVFTEKLNTLNIPYMVTGSVAAIVYGEPRLTHDIDLVLTLPSSRVDAFCKLFPQDQFYCPPPEILEAESLKENRGHCNLVHHDSGFKADIFFAGQDSFMNWALEHVNNIVFLSTLLPLAPVEYVIIKKLEYYSEGQSPKHLADIQAILRHSTDNIDLAFLENTINQQGLTSAWKRCLSVT